MRTACTYSDEGMASLTKLWSSVQEVEERLKQEIQPLAADLSLPPGLELKMKGAQKGVGYGGSKETQGYTKVTFPLFSQHDS